MNEGCDKLLIIMSTYSTVSYLRGGGQNMVSSVFDATASMMVERDCFVDQVGS